MRLRALLLAALAVGSTACTPSGPPELTVYADGDAATLAPVRYCDAQVTECSGETEATSLTLQPGDPLQISVPPDVAETPWVVYVESVDEQGRVLKPQQHYFGPDESLAFTARPGAGRTLRNVEVQQLGGRIDADGQIPVRGFWVVRLRERR